MALTLSHFRFGVHEGTESSHGWWAAEDANIQFASGTPLLLRACVQADGTGLNNVDLEWQYRLNGGAWTNITTSSAVVRTGATTVFANGADCTKRLSGTGTFVTNNNGCTQDGSAGGTTNDIPASGCTETEIAVQVLSAGTAVGDLIEFRLTRDGGNLLDAYAVVPTLSVSVQVFPVASRQPGVTNNQGNPNAVPAGAAGKSWFVQVQAAQADLDATDVSFGLSMYVRQPDSSWAFNAGITFAGGPNQGRGGTPTVAPGWMQLGDEVAGKDVYFELNNTGRAVALGLVATAQ